MKPYLHQHLIIALFGEAERGAYQHPYVCENLGQLLDLLGQPPADSRGIQMAIQALMFNRTLIFFRVREEGFSLEDYQRGLYILQHENLIPHFSALAIPGVGNPEIVQKSHELCVINKGILLFQENDLYDYLTEGHLVA